ncbi:hypothetical protein [Mycolicibacterium porcinum]|uniref:hypothetical protein n=1 Tax=Mycolicibacterium porcinum TaxID=39693 RepID=UPI001041D6D6|nr:hypothetical protein [Mycolicibacterium porcinum]
MTRATFFRIEKRVALMWRQRLIRFGITVPPVMVGVLSVVFDVNDLWNRRALAAAVFLPFVVLWLWAIKSDFRSAFRYEEELTERSRKYNESLEALRRDFRMQLERILDLRLSNLMKQCVSEDASLSGYPVDDISWRIDCGHRGRQRAETDYWLKILGPSSTHLPGPEYSDVVVRKAGGPLPSQYELQNTGADERGELDVRFLVLVDRGEEEFSNLTLCASVSFPCDLEFMSRVIFIESVQKAVEADSLATMLMKKCALKHLSGEWVIADDSLSAERHAGAAISHNATGSTLQLSSVKEWPLIS